MSVHKILKTKGIIKVEPHDSHASALMKLSSSHDAAFVFDKDELLGLINPYHSLIKKSLPSNVKLKNSMVHPPKISMQTSLDKIMHLMSESKIHYLPVFDGANFKGIVTARRLLDHILTDEKLKMPIGTYLKERKLHTLQDTEFVSKAMTHFRENKVSKLVVVDDKGLLSGVLAYYDVIKHLSEPRDRQNILSRKGEKNPLLQKPIRNFFKKDVLVLSKTHTLADAVKLILEKSIGSVVITEKNRPIGIITTKDIFSAYLDKPRTGIAQLHSKGLSTASKYMAEAFTQTMDRILRRSKDVEKADITIIAKKDGALYEADVAVSQKGKRPFALKVESRRLTDLLSEVGKKARRLLRRK
ncbi:CBS domain-containing protein [Candidatus Woesebacteria bacterium]|nr:CBS domain-containing protein [Candidatus Woesebacteria bacterium]